MIKFFSYLSLFNPGHLNLLAHCCEISLRFQLARLVQHLSGLFSSRIYHVFVLSGINPLSPKSDERQISPCNINAL